jgi:serine/threonine protein kinase/Tfp pilus assembly protein PilF
VNEHPESPRPSDVSTVAVGPGANASDAIGPYRLLQKLGEGGMGEVWLAEQTDPVRRRVALKLIKVGMDTKQVVGRFEAERQALALMDHPSVAKVFDAGSTAEGRPYFVMEYVAGVPITEHCDRHRLTVRERLELFMDVCGGVQHAHQKAIIHRDLKPSNVLVSLQDGKAAPKIIDFGVAKATAQRLTEETVFTELGVLIGTPEYMSPEQADLTGQDVDVRTDVYALGVVLYELLVGVLPFEPRELRRAGLDGIRRMIREVEPPRPSTRLDTLEAARSTDSARCRHVDVPTLRRELSGDLDWVVMKALDKERARRYGSPAELAADLAHHLRDEPVQARPPSTTYRARKFVRRHRIGVAFAATGAVALVGFAVTMAVQAERLRAQMRQTEREAKAKAQVSTFLTDLFRVSDPSQARGRTITARELLDRGEAKIRSTLTDQPEVRAELLATMARVYDNLGLFERAEALQKEAFDARRRVLGDDHADTLWSMNALANVYVGRGRYAEAEALYRETLERRKRVLGPEHPDTLISMFNLALVRQRQGRAADAETLFRETLEIQKRVLGPEHAATLKTMVSIAGALSDQKRYPEAEASFRDAVAVEKRVLGPDHPDALLATVSMGYAMSAQGRFADAEAIYRDALETQKRVLGPDHPDTLKTMNTLAGVLLDQRRYAPAEPIYRDLLEARKRVLGISHPDTLWSFYNLGCLASLQGKRQDALGYLREAVDHGFADADTFGRDADLAPLKNDPEFQRIVGVARKNRERAAGGK